MIYLYLALGGAAGTLARFAISGWVYANAGAGFPWGTLAVNTLGSFILGFAMRGLDVIPVEAELRALITIGFCGAFTTFSTVSFETVALVQEGAWQRAGLYALGTFGFGLAGLIAGLALATILFRTGG
jgi:fluoride exporter